MRKINYPSQKRILQNQKDQIDKIDTGEITNQEVSILEKRLRTKLSIINGGS